MTPDTPRRVPPAHELVLLDDIAALTAVLAERAVAGLAAGDAVGLAVDPATAEEVLDLVASRTGTREHGSDLQVLTPPGSEDIPVTVLARSRAAASDIRADQRVRLLHHAHVMPAHAWWDWARVEAAVPLTLPVAQQTCVYLRADLDPGQEQLLRTTHSLLATGTDSGRPNPDHVAAVPFLATHVAGSTGMPDSPPTNVLEAPTVALARAAVEAAAGDADLDPARVDGLLLGVTECLANALQHGRDPVSVRLWQEAGALQVAVTDGGTGPSEPLVGLVRDDTSAGGDGLWLTHQLTHVRHHRGEDGYTVLLTLPR